MLLFNSQSYKRSRERKGEDKTNSHLVSSIVANFVAHVGSVAANEVCIGEYLRRPDRHFASIPRKSWHRLIALLEYYFLGKFVNTRTRYRLNYLHSRANISSLFKFEIEADILAC